jgi:hypothetical protein
VEQQVHIFIFIVSQGASNRAAQERFQHTGETISRCFKKVLRAVVALGEDYIRLVELERYEDCVTEISRDAKFYPYFKDCIRAIDGSLIPVAVPAAQEEKYMCRKGFKAQNVLAAVSFDLCFQYVLVGWEGTAHDGRVLDDALELGFKIPENNYLADAGYRISPQFLTPYCGVRYHLKEWALGTVRPAAAKCQRTVQPIYAILRCVMPSNAPPGSFKVFNTPIEYDINAQADLVGSATKRSHNETADA